ncbi:MAG: hypothetical protein CBD54_000120 [Alphaproteobacteria bacterium TMED194]|jgi:hypothetical protein|nr:MAG: hypothetical protein CBD54_000730 [Alphaproteobacteria bacterium TMED194]RPH09606.1 MAG: hypothetical protein CBD54_000120 [Alphaproteobacteria bacterium TMED194]|tara:strand:+ start:15 stop:395 length:381 start_codon:yes stop_codon:yes gene_type:complete
MDKDNRAKVLEAYNRYLNAIIEADIDAINECIDYPLAYIGGDSVKMLDKFPIDPQEWKEKTGWATSNAFEIDVVAVTEKKAHLLMRNCRRLRYDGSLIEEASAFYAFKTTDAGWKMYAFSDITFPA